MSKSFKEYLSEREKTEHEPILRKIASDARSEAYHSGFKDAKRMANYGDCGHVSHIVVKKLQQSGYKSAHVVDGYYNRDKDDGDPVPHSWVHIPEIKHFIDPTHDQMTDTKRKSAPTKNEKYPDNMVKIGKIKGKFHKRKYTDYSRSEEEYE